MHAAGDEARQFDVLLLPNLYGDIVSICARVWRPRRVGAANLGGDIGVFEEDGSAPDIAGKNLANPTALLLSAVMMLRHMDEGAAADRIMRAHASVLTSTIRTRDLGGTATTTEFADAIAQQIVKSE